MMVSNRNLLSKGPFSGSMFVLAGVKLFFSGSRTAKWAKDPDPSRPCRIDRFQSCPQVIGLVWGDPGFLGHTNGFLGFLIWFDYAWQPGMCFSQNLVFFGSRAKRFWAPLCWMGTLPKTNSSPRKIGKGPQKETRLPSIKFSGVNSLFVSGRVMRKPQHQLLFWGPNTFPAKIRQSLTKPPGSSDATFPVGFVARWSDGRSERCSKCVQWMAASIFFKPLKSWDQQSVWVNSNEVTWLT